MFSGNCDLERLMSLNWAAPMTFFSPPNLILESVSYDCIFLRSNTDVQHAVVSRFQSCTALNVYHQSEIFVISQCNSLVTTSDGDSYQLIRLQ